MLCINYILFNSEILFDVIIGNPPYNANGLIKGMNEYNLTIFSMRYEYITYTTGRVEVGRVPIQSVFQEAQKEISTTNKQIIQKSE